MNKEVTLDVLKLESSRYCKFEHKTLTNSDGSRLRARSNGRLITWKTRPTEFKLPCKHGMRDYFYITDTNCDEWEIV